MHAINRLWQIVKRLLKGRVKIRQQIKTDHICCFQSANFPKISKAFYGFTSGKYGKLFIISNGMGDDGVEILSHLAVMSIKDYFKNTRFNIQETLLQSIQKVKRDVISYISDNQKFSNSDVSLAILLISQIGCFIAHCGDCKILLLRNNMISDIVKGNRESLFEQENRGLVHLDPEIQNITPLYKYDKILLMTKEVYQKISLVELQEAFSSRKISSCLRTLEKLIKTHKSFDDFKLIAVDIIKAQDCPENIVELKKAKKESFFILILFYISLTFFVITVYPYIKSIFRHFYAL